MVNKRLNQPPNSPRGYTIAISCITISYLNYEHIRSLELRVIVATHQDFTELSNFNFTHPYSPGSRFFICVGPERNCSLVYCLIIDTPDATWRTPRLSSTHSDTSLNRTLSAIIIMDLVENLRRKMEELKKVEVRKGAQPAPRPARELLLSVHEQAV